MNFFFDKKRGGAAHQGAHRDMTKNLKTGYAAHQGDSIIRKGGGFPA
jgi:hypothetical protein